MAVRKIEAEVECDGCGKALTVRLDPAGSMKDATLFDLVEDTVRGMLFHSVQGEHMLCRDCTKRVDEALDEDAVPTHDQVAAILNAAAGLGMNSEITGDNRP